MGNYSTLIVERSRFALRDTGYKTHVHAHGMTDRNQVTFSSYEPGVVTPRSRDVGCLSFKTEEVHMHLYVEDIDFLKGLRDLLSEKIKEIEKSK